MPKGRPMRRQNGKGTVVKLSGNRRKPFEVRVNTYMDERNYPSYDVLGRYEDRDTALEELLKYTRDPYDVKADKLTFSQLYDLWFDWKYVKSKKEYSKSSIACTKGAYKKCSLLHNKVFKQIKTPDMQVILDDYTLSHAYMEHIQVLFKQLYKYALQFDYVDKDYAAFTQITKEEDDQPGEPFTQEDIDKLWKHVKDPWVDTILIFIYSGWRISELLKMPLKNIDTVEMTFRGGVKTRASKNRVVPIHHKIQSLVINRKKCAKESLFDISIDHYYDEFNAALISCGITVQHTPHDCRHTFATLLDNAGANPISIKRLMGHSSGNDVTEKVYIDKDICQLRKAIEMIK